MRLKLILALCAALAGPCGALAQVFPVPQVESGFTIRSQPTNTLLREAANARAILVLIPGGEGQIGLKPDWRLEADVRTALGRTMYNLTQPSITSGTTHVVMFDSPVVLPMRPQIPERSTRDHMVRIESVVRFYKDRFKLPVWLMGHSNGGYSIAEFQKYLVDEKKDGLVSGYVFSAGRDISRFGPALDVPVLFIISANDACHSTTPAGNQRLFERVKAVNKAATEFVLIQSSSSDGGDPCTTGTHMYRGAPAEVAEVLDRFITAHTPKQ